MMLSDRTRPPEPFERHPALASWIESLGDTKMGLSPGDWCVFIGVLNRALTDARAESEAERGELVEALDWAASIIEAAAHRMDRLGQQESARALEAGATEARSLLLRLGGDK